MSRTKDVASINIIPPLKKFTSLHRAFMQQIIARQCVSKAEALDLLQICVDLSDPTIEVKNFTFKSIIDQINEVLKAFKFRIAAVRGENDGRVYFVYLTDDQINIELGQGPGGVLRDVFHVVFHRLTTDTANPLTLSGAKNLRADAQRILTARAAASGAAVDDGEDGSGGGGGGGMAKVIPPKAWEEALDRLLSEKWLALAASSSISAPASVSSISTAQGKLQMFVGPRSSGELKHQLRTACDICEHCKQACVCPNLDHLDRKGVRMHLPCAKGTVEVTFYDEKPLRRGAGRKKRALHAEEEEEGEGEEIEEVEEEEEEEEEDVRGAGGGGKRRNTSTPKKGGAKVGKPKKKYAQEDETDEEDGTGGGGRTQKTRGQRGPEIEDDTMAGGRVVVGRKSR